MRQQGFTITELLIAVSVSGIASILIVSAFVFTYGSVIAEQARTSMVRESQLFLRRLSDDIRVGSEIRSTNQLTDPFGPTGGWVTSDPANILIITEPATDADNNLIFDDQTGYPYQHEVIYFSDNGNMYRRRIANINATGSVQSSTCPIGTADCSPDIELVGNVENMQFSFYDIDNAVTTVPEEARSVDVTINLRQTLYGNQITSSNTIRATLRNEN